MSTTPSNGSPEPSNTARSRRPYDVWERKTLYEVNDDATSGEPVEHQAWVCLAEAVEATTRDGAIDQVRDGRNGVFATVLYGERIISTRDDPQRRLADDIAARLTAAGVNGADVQAAVCAAFEAQAGGA